MTRLFYYLAGLLAFICISWFVLTPAFAQEAGAIIAPSSIWYEVWTIVQPVAVLLVSTVGPVLVAWISARLISLLKITDEKQRVDIESKLRDALHQSAANAVRFALAKAGVIHVGGRVSDSILADAAKYVIEKNPEAIEKLGVNAKALNEIIMSKLPEMIQGVGVRQVVETAR
ncbi:hypothetical protein [Agrobacterium sp. S7/73]|uniref:hypothetical protein n=1 Tax=Agrobacterium sp. S7/73 TaxID=2820002 RepID=UPI001C5BA191|nr:hypothetical protein [Agrobacterium sp. S7/73]QXZ71852.1 hypothetical protein J5276_12240 [Agrobacterium sp. S7/73]QXZ74640.1 hypothetical protein J5276_18855 [Agrobacterium sp. S7/73]